MKPSAVAPTFQTFFDAYFELIAERISPSTASSYRQTAERYLLPRFGAWRPGDQRVFIADIRKAEQDLGWTPKIGPEEGVDELLRWVRDNEALFREM